MLRKKKKKIEEADAVQLRLLREQFTVLDSERVDILRRMADWQDNYRRMTEAVLKLEEKYDIHD